MKNRQQTLQHLLDTVPNLKELLNASDKEIKENLQKVVRDEMYFKQVTLIPTHKVYVNCIGTIILVDGIPKATYKVPSKAGTFRIQTLVGKKKYYVHRLVAAAFVPNPKPVSFKLVCHKNGKSEDNFYMNLVWGNVKTYTELNKKNYPHLTNYVLREDGKTSHSKLTKDDRFDIANRLEKGELAKVLAAEYGVSDMTITRVRQMLCKTKVVSPKYDRQTKKLIAQFFEDDKHSDKVIATITGIRYETIWRWRKKWKDGNFPEDISVGLNGQKLKTGKRRSKMHNQPKLQKKLKLKLK